MPETADNATQTPAPSTPVTPPVVVPPQAATGDVTALQAAIDAAVAKAVKATKAETEASIAADLGVDKLGDAKAALTAKREADDAAKTETERRESAAAEREKAAEAREAAAVARERNAAITGALVAAGAPAANVGDLVALVRLPDEAPDLDAAAKEAVEGVKAKFAALFAAPGAPSGVPGGAPPIGQAPLTGYEAGLAEGQAVAAAAKAKPDFLAGMNVIGRPYPVSSN